MSSTSLQSLIGDAQTYVNAGSYSILDTIYSENAVLLNNALEIISGQTAVSAVPLPLLGFHFNPSQTIQLLNFEYSRYPYLNKKMISNSVVQNETRFSLEIIDTITSDNTVITAIAKRQLLITLLNKYILAGGLFTILTLGGTISNCLMEDFSWIGRTDRFVANFVKPLFSTTDTSEQLSSTLKSLQNGGVASIS